MVRHVRTLEGARFYNLPIGAPITRDVIDAAKRNAALKGLKAPKGAITRDKLSSVRPVGGLPNPQLPPTGLPKPPSKPGKMPSAAPVVKIKSVNKKPKFSGRVSVTKSALSGPVNFKVGTATYSVPEGSRLVRKKNDPTIGYVHTPDGEVHVFNEKGEVAVTPEIKQALKDVIGREDLNPSYEVEKQSAAPKTALTNSASKLSTKRTLSPQFVPGMKPLVPPPLKKRSSEDSAIGVTKDTPRDEYADDPVEFPKTVAEAEKTYGWKLVGDLDEKKGYFDLEHEDSGAVLRLERLPNGDWVAYDKEHGKEYFPRKESPRDALFYAEKTMELNGIDYGIQAPQGHIRTIGQMSHGDSTLQDKLGESIQDIVPEAEWRKNLSPEEADLHEHYTGFGYNYMNPHARDPEKFAKSNSTARVQETVQAVKSMDELFDKHAEISTKPLTVLRSTDNFRELTDLKVGDTYREPAYLSTSAGLSAMEYEGFGGGYDNQDRWITVFDVPEGTRFIPGADEADEVIFGRGSNSRVTKIDHDRQMVYMSMLPEVPAVPAQDATVGDSVHVSDVSNLPVGSEITSPVGEITVMSDGSVKSDTGLVASPAALDTVSHLLDEPKLAVTRVGTGKPSDPAIDVPPVDLDKALQGMIPPPGSDWTTQQRKANERSKQGNQAGEELWGSGRGATF